MRVGAPRGNGAGICTWKVCIYMYLPPLEPSHPSHLGKMGSELRSEPSQSRHKGVTPADTRKPVLRVEGRVGCSGTEYPRRSVNVARLEAPTKVRPVRNPSENLRQVRSDNLPEQQVAYVIGMDAIATVINRLERIRVRHERSPGVNDVAGRVTSGDPVSKGR